MIPFSWANEMIWLDKKSRIWKNNLLRFQANKETSALYNSMYRLVRIRITVLSIYIINNISVLWCTKWYVIRYVLSYTYFFFKFQARIFQQLSQGGSRGSNGSGYHPVGEITGYLEEIGDGEVRIGRISFRTDQVLGKGCEGTFVYRQVDLLNHYIIIWKVCWI